MISASESADGNAYLLASCEVSGTVAAYKLISQNIDSSDDDNTDNNHDNNIDHNGSGHGGADTEDLNNQESKTNALKTGDHAPVIGTGIGMVLALSAIIVILKYRRSGGTGARAGGGAERIRKQKAVNTAFCCRFKSVKGNMAFPGKLLDNTLEL